MVAQLLFSIVAWTALAATVASTLTARPVKLAGFAAFLILSLSPSIILWDRTLMSESFAISLTVFAVAAAIFAIKARTTYAVVYFLIVITLWGFSRDSNLLLLPIFVLAVAICWWRSRNRFWALIAVPMIGLFVFGSISASIGDRWVVPFYNVVVFRVVPDEAKRQDLMDLGLPVNDLLVQRSQGQKLDGVALEVDPGLSQLHDWARSTGRLKYMVFLAKNPGRSIGEPFADVEEIIDQDVVSLFIPPGPTTVLGNKLRYFYNFPFGVPGAVAITLVATAIIFVGLRIYKRHALWLPLVLLISVIPHGLIVWHADTAVIGRHSMLVAVQLRIALYLSLVIGLDLLWPHRHRISHALKLGPAAS